MELEITWEIVARIWWAYIWRSFIITLISIAVGMIVFVILFVIFFYVGTHFFVGSNIPLDVVKSIGLIISLISFIIPFLLSIIAMKLTLRKDFGEFRLVLIGNN